MEIRQGNTALLEYGIQTEQSDIRAHVCVKARRIYVYSRQAGMDAIESGNYRQALGYQRGVTTATAKGYLVPPMRIRGCMSIEPSPDTWEWIAFRDDEGTATKGRKAMQLVMWLIRSGFFPLPLVPAEVFDLNCQIRGEDVIIKPAKWERPLVIQVKCDYAGGEREFGGTGNLYLQTAECNPLRQH